MRSAASIARAGVLTHPIHPTHEGAYGMAVIAADVARPTDRRVGIPIRVSAVLNSR